MFNFPFKCNYTPLNKEMINYIKKSNNDYVGNFKLLKTYKKYSNNTKNDDYDFDLCDLSDYGDDEYIKKKTNTYEKQYNKDNEINKFHDNSFSYIRYYSDILVLTLIGGSTIMTGLYYFYYKK
jgi:hypothetical protein